MTLFVSQVSELVPQSKKLQGIQWDRTEPEQLKLIEGKKRVVLVCQPVQLCVCTSLGTATCHSKRSMPSSHQVHPPSAIRNYPVITG